MTMVVIRMVVSMLWRVRDQVSRPRSAARAKAPMAPMAPDSVGVAQPAMMVPRTRKISPRDGRMPHRHWDNRARLESVLASGGRAGTHCGLKILTRAMNRQNSRIWTRLGPMAPL